MAVNILIPTALRNYAGGTDFMYCTATTPDGKIHVAGGQDSVFVSRSFGLNLLSSG